MPALAAVRCRTPASARSRREATEGPFYFDPKLERAAISPKASRASPLNGAAAGRRCGSAGRLRARASISGTATRKGHYSGYPGQGDGRRCRHHRARNSCAAWQTTDAAASSPFETIYPGWYRGRTTHIHFKVFPNDNSVLTGQMYFPDGLSEQIFTTVAPYTDRSGKRDTLNAR